MFSKMARKGPSLSDKLDSPNLLFFFSSAGNIDHEEPSNAGNGKGPLNKLYSPAFVVVLLLLP